MYCIFFHTETNASHINTILCYHQINFYAYLRQYEKVLELMHEIVNVSLCSLAEAYRIGMVHKFITIHTLQHSQIINFLRSKDKIARIHTHHSNVN